MPAADEENKENVGAVSAAPAATTEAAEPITYVEFSRSGIHNLFLHEQSPHIKEKQMDWAVRPLHPMD